MTVLPAEKAKAVGRTCLGERAAGGGSGGGGGGGAVKESSALLYSILFGSGAASGAALHGPVALCACVCACALNENTSCWAHARGNRDLLLACSSPEGEPATVNVIDACYC